MIDLVGKRHIFLLASLAIIVPGLIALSVGGLKPGIEFTGGTRWEIKPLNHVVDQTEKFKQVLADTGHEGALVKQAKLGGGDGAEDIVVIDLPGAIGGEAKAMLEGAFVGAGLVGGREVTEFVSSNEAPTGDAQPSTEKPSSPQESVTRMRLGEGVEVGFAAIGPTVGSELAGRATLAVAAASAAILVYLTVVFRKVPGALRYGVCAVVALLHDVLIILGIFAILGLLTGYEIDALFVTALLTIIGFSVHDTIVVFDRVRENILKRRFERFDETVNYSLLQTLGRSINTSVTVVLTLFALYLFGGATIKGFALVLLIGIVSGTYSSIFNASMLLVLWENRDWQTWLRALRGQRTAAGAPKPTAG